MPVTTPFVWTSHPKTMSAWLVWMGHQDHEDHQEWLVVQDQLVDEVHQDNLETMVCQDPMDPKVHEVNEDDQDHQLQVLKWHLKMT